MLSCESLKVKILQMAGNYGADVTATTRAALADLPDMDKEALVSRLAEIPEHAAPVSAMIIKLWTWVQAAKEADRRNEETARVCRERWPGPPCPATTGGSTGDDLDSLIDNLPDMAPGPTPSRGLMLGDRGGRSLRDLVKLIREKDPESHIDKRRLLLEVWDREGLHLSEKQRAWFLRYCSPPEAVTRTARGF